MFTVPLDPSSIITFLSQSALGVNEYAKFTMSPSISSAVIVYSKLSPTSIATSFSSEVISGALFLLITVIELPEQASSPVTLFKVPLIKSLPVSDGVYVNVSSTELTKELYSFSKSVSPLVSIMVIPSISFTEEIASTETL